VGQGDQPAFQVLVQRHLQRSLDLARRMTASASDAEEVAQEAFLRAWACRDRYSPGKPFWPWLVTIARRICIDRGRRRRVAAALDPKAVSIFDGVPVLRPDELVEATADGELARAALADLRPNQRRMLTRRAVDGWSYAQIADAEGVTEEAVRGMLRRARHGLRAAYARVAGSAPVAIPIAAFRWARRRAATVPALNMDFIRASEAAVVAAAALAIGAAPGSAAPSTPPRVAPVVAIARTGATQERASAVQPRAASLAAGSQHVPHTTGPASSGHVPTTTATTAPAGVKVAYLADDNEIDRACAAANVKARVGHARACVNTDGSIQTAKILIETRKVDP